METFVEHQVLWIDLVLVIYLGALVEPGGFKSRDDHRSRLNMTKNDVMMGSYHLLKPNGTKTG
jgi:hypothetical protein